jgi:hypothetical protein
MSAAILEPHIFDELKAALNHGVAAGELLTSLQIEQQTALFRDRFGPAVLRELNGEALLRLMKLGAWLIGWSSRTMMSSPATNSAELVVGQR